MQEYFLSARPQHGPLFYFESGHYLTRGIVSDLLRDSARVAGVPYQSLKGHSFCIGAASVVVAAGWPDWLIKVLDRWSSDCYQRYIRTAAALPFKYIACKPILLSDPARAVLHSARSAGEISEVFWSRYRQKSHRLT